MDDQQQTIVTILQDNYLVFKALGDKKRQQVLFTLSNNPHLSVGELAAHMCCSRPTVSHHIKILKQAGLLIEDRVGMRRYYRPSFVSSVQAMEQLASSVKQSQYLVNREA